MLKITTLEMKGKPVIEEYSTRTLWQMQ